MSMNPSISGGFAQDYIDKLDAALKDAENRLRINNAYYNGAAFAYNEAKIWEGKLERYWNNIKTTGELAINISRELDKLNQQIICVCDNAAGYHEAIKILVCCVKEVACDLEFMSNELVKLCTRIDCVKSKDPVLDTSKSILKCLYEFKTKLETTLKSALEALKAALALLRSAALILDEKKALRDYIDELPLTGTGTLKFNETPSNLNEECKPITDTPTDECIVVYLPPCEVPAKVLPKIEPDKFKVEFETAKAKSDIIYMELEKARKVRDGALTKRDAAIKALADAKAAKICK
jgi:hypothetical protein